MLEGAQPDRVLGELVDLVIERRMNICGDVAMDPIETHSSPVSDEDGRALAEKASGSFFFFAAVAHAQGRHRRGQNTG